MAIKLLTNYMLLVNVDLKIENATFYVKFFQKIQKPLPKEWPNQ